MATTDLTLVVMAAGMGSRYGGLKQLEGVGPHHQTILDYSIYDAIEAGFSKVVFIFELMVSCNTFTTVDVINKELYFSNIISQNLVCVEIILKSLKFELCLIISRIYSNAIRLDLLIFYVYAYFWC